LVDRSQAGDSTLRLTAHLAPLGESAAEELDLLLEDPKRKDHWLPVARAQRSTDGSDLATFELPGYTDQEDGTPRAYKVVWQGDSFDGLIRAEPKHYDDWVLASLSCLKNQVGPIAWNSSGMWFPHEGLVGRVTAADPDLLYFSGDQIYEGDLTGPPRKDLQRAIGDYQTKYRRFLWAFGDLLRDRPSVLIPDDHDVFHGNLWGAGGVRAKAKEELTAQDSGGYTMPAEFVNVVHRSLTSNLPPSRVTPTIGQGITTYTTGFVWGHVNFAVLADRMWKDSPSVMAPEARYRNGWIQNGDVDARDTDVPGAQLLGSEQERFLEEWARAEERGTWTRVVLSQSPFSCLHS
ncbi:MAG: alkaline phosphatase D family protein, partial [Planctomycetes bacterium]|nr:alkaline phosphatase D family protein [Planctomycetota bacterium]